MVQAKGLNGTHNIHKMAKGKNRTQHFPLLDHHRQNIKDISEGITAMVTGTSYPKFQDGNQNRNRIKRILYWTPLYDRADYMFGYGREPFIKAGCHVDMCETTAYKSLLNSSDAVVFHGSYVQNLSALAPYHLPNQYWVYANKESPYWKLFNLSLFNGVFNLSMTHKPNSDAWLTYGALVPLTAKEKTHMGMEPPQNHAKYKSHLVAWMVSHCGAPSHRGKYTKELQKFIPVDVYGKCGSLNYPRFGDYMDMLEKKYKFYLAFENTICDDYITEKLWRTMTRYIVPIVLGGGDYQALLPKHSYINVEDFKNPEKLAAYLLELDSNDTLYNEYFEWKKHNKVVSPYRERPFCDLCAYLHEGQPKVIEDLEGWYGSKETVCYDPQMFYHGVRVLDTSRNPTYWEDHIDWTT